MQYLYFTGPSSQSFVQAENFLALSLHFTKGATYMYFDFFPYERTCYHWQKMKEWMHVFF